MAQLNTYKPEARGCAEETQMTPLESSQNQPKINPESIQIRLIIDLTIDTESTENRRRIDSEPMGTPQGITLWDPLGDSSGGSPPGDPVGSAPGGS